MKVYKCGLCKKDNQYIGTRAGLRKHLKDEHRIMSEIANADVKGKSSKQKWWLTEER